jgi:hypothetical protein
MYIHVVQPTTKCSMPSSTSYTHRRRSCNAFGALGLLLLLCNLPILCTAFLVRSPSLTVPGQDSCLSPVKNEGRCVLPPLHSKKGSDFWPIKLFRREKKQDDKYASSRTSSYLVTMDKQRGYHRKPNGPLAVVNNTDVKFMSADKMAGALGKLSSQAFK